MTCATDQTTPNDEDGSTTFVMFRGSDVSVFSTVN